MRALRGEGRTRGGSAQRALLSVGLSATPSAWMRQHGAQRISAARVLFGVSRLLLAAVNARACAAARAEARSAASSARMRISSPPARSAKGDASRGDTGAPLRTGECAILPARARERSRSAAAPAATPRPRNTSPARRGSAAAKRRLS
jgi:hypothetical protein